VDPIRFAVWAGFVACHHAEMTDHGEIRRRVLDYAKEALEGGELPTSTAMIDGVEQEIVTSAGIFRLALDKLGVDRHDLHAQEVFFARVDAAITVGLAEGSEDWPPRLGR
jgi:hypothetical protein